MMSRGRRRRRRRPPPARAPSPFSAPPRPAAPRPRARRSPEHSRVRSGTRTHSRVARPEDDFFGPARH